MDEKQFKILTEQLNEIVKRLEKNNWYQFEIMKVLGKMSKHLEKMSRLALDAKYDEKTKNVHIESVEYDD